MHQLLRQPDLARRVCKAGFLGLTVFAVVCVPASQAGEPPQGSVPVPVPVTLSAYRPAVSAASAGAYLVHLHERARQTDAAYQAALAEFEVARFQASAAFFAMAPEVRISESFLENESSSRRTISLTQPLFSIERISTFQEADIRGAQAQATLKLREYELAQRLLRSLSELIRSNEGIRTNAARVRTLESELERTQMELRLGKGTLTDVRDTQVRLEQARASDLALQARRLSAIASLEAMLGERPDEGRLTLDRTPRRIELGTFPQAWSQAQSLNPLIINAASAERLAELAHQKARGAYLPQVGYSISRTERMGSSFSSQGFVFSLPLQAGNFVSLGAARANINKASATRRQAEEQVRVDLQRFMALVLSGAEESNQRLDAIRSAQLSQEANEASFKGGVRTRIDVLNSIQTVFQVHEEFVNSLMTLAENRLGFGIQSAEAPDDAVAALHALLFSANSLSGH